MVFMDIIIRVVIENHRTNSTYE